MSFEKCALEARQTYKLSDEQMAILKEDLDSILREARDSNLPVNKIIDSTINKRIVDIKMNEMERWKTMEVYETNVAYLDQADFKGKEIEAVMSLLEPTSKYKYEGRGSIFTKKKAIHDQLQSIVDQEIYRHKGAMKRAVKGEFDRDLFRAVVDGETNIDSTVLAISKAIRKANDTVYNFKKATGSTIRYLNDYLIKQSHNAEAIFDMGEKAWRSLAEKTFDFNRMGLFEPDAIDTYLTNFFYNRARELEQTRGSKITTDFKSIQTSRPGQRMSAGRNVHFKNGDSAYRYYKALNPDESVYQRLVKSFDRDSSQIASMEIFGPNYKAGFKALMSEAKKKHFAAGGKEASFKFDASQKSVEIAFKAVSDGEFQGKMNWKALTGNALRKITDMSKLWAALPTTVTDFSLIAGVVNAETGANYGQVLAKSIKNTFENFISPANRRQAAIDLGIYANEANGSTMNIRFGEYGAGLGVIDKLHNATMRATGLPNQAVSAKLGAAKILGQELAANSSKKFSDLSQAPNLKHFGIKEKEWDIIKHAVNDDLKAITPPAIVDLPDEAFGGLKGFELTKEKLRLSQALQEYMMFLSERGSPTTGLKQMALKNAFDRNTYHGQLLQFATQYKSFAIAIWDTLQTIRYTNGGKYGNIPALANTMVTGTAFGALALLMKDYVNGRELRIPKDGAESAQFLGEAFLQSGSGTIWMDLAFQDYEKSYISLPSQLIGPAISGPVSDFAELTAMIMRTDWSRETERTKALRKTLIAVEKNSPTIPFLKAAVNKNVFDAVHKVMNTRRRAPKNKNRFKHDLTQYFD